MMGRGSEGGIGAHSSGMSSLQQLEQHQAQKMSNPRSGVRGLDIYAQAVKALALKSPFGGDEGANAGGGGAGHVGPMVKLPSGADPKRKNRARKTQVVSKKRSYGESEDGNPRLFWSQMEDYFREVGATDMKLLFPRTSFSMLDSSHAQDSCFSIPPLGRRYADVWAEEDRKLKPETPAVPPGVTITMTKSAAARGIKRKLLTASPVSKKKKSIISGGSELITTVVSPPESEEYELCHVCNGGDSEALNQIVYCDSCNVAVHQECYGAHGIGDGQQWLCSWCCYRRGGGEVGFHKCVLCPVKTGALKPVASDPGSDPAFKRFAHLFCSQWVPETYVHDALAMEPIRNVEGVREERWRLLCVICNEKHGACIQCSHGLCATPFHPLCARDAKLWMELSSREDTEDLEVRAYCQKHSAARMGKGSLDDEKNAGGSPQNGKRVEEQPDLPRPELIASLKKVTQLLDVTLETVASESDLPLPLLVLWVEGKLPHEDKNFTPRLSAWLRRYLRRIEADENKKNGFVEQPLPPTTASETNACSQNMVSQPAGEIGQVKTNCQMLDAEDEFNDELEERHAREELNAAPASEATKPGTPDVEPQLDANESDAYVAPGIVKRLQASSSDHRASSPPAFSQQRHGGGVEEQWNQLRQAKHLGVLDWLPQDELEAELFLLQNQLIDCASSNRCLSERLISKVLCQLSKERQAARKQMLDLSVVSQFLADAKEARKQGRREKRDREAQAVLAAATAAAAASPRTGYVKREGVQDDAYAAAHEVNHHQFSPFVRPFRPPVPKPPRLNVPSAPARAQPVYKNSPVQQQQQQQQQQQFQEEQAACDVCSSSDSIRSNRIIRCSRCNVSVHQDCYGVSRFPSGVWYCQPCSEFQQQLQPVKLESLEKVSPGVQCALCPNTSGAFKKSSDGRWVHVFCALWLPKSTFGKEHTSPIGGLDAVPAERLNLNCNICQQQQGACIKCNVGYCAAAFHPICARDAGLYLNVRGIGGKPQYRAYCERHSPQQRAKSADSLSYAALKQYGTPDEISALRQIRVEFERVRLICERICKRERIKRELTQCVKDLYISQLMAVTGGHSVESVGGGGLQRPFDVNGAASYSDALVDVPWTAESRLTSPAGESIWPVGRGSGVIVKEVTSKRSVLPEPESHKKSRKYNRHSEPLGREKVMTPTEASMHNKLLPKGYAYVPVDLLDKGKQQEQLQQQQQQLLFDKKT